MVFFLYGIYIEIINVFYSLHMAAVKDITSVTKQSYILFFHYKYSWFVKSLTDLVCWMKNDKNFNTLSEKL